MSMLTAPTGSGEVRDDLHPPDLLLPLPMSQPLLDINDMRWLCGRRMWDEGKNSFPKWCHDRCSRHPGVSPAAGTSVCSRGVLFHWPVGCLLSARQRCQNMCLHVSTWLGISTATATTSIIGTTTTYNLSAWIADEKCHDQDDCWRDIYHNHYNKIHHHRFYYPWLLNVKKRTWFHLLCFEKVWNFKDRL